MDDDLDPTGVDTGAEGASIDDNGTGQAVTAPDEAVQEPTGSEHKYPSTWNKILEAVPEAFHPIVAPTLKEWDRNYGRLAESYAPYKQFAQQGIDADSLNNAYQLYNLLNTNPHEVLRRLQVTLGVNQEPQAPVQEIQSVEDEPEEVPSEYQQIQQQMHQMQQQNQELQRQVMVDQYQRQIDNDIQSLLKKHGQFDVGDVMNRYMAQMQRGEEPSIVKAFQEQQTFIQNWQKANPVQPQAPQPPSVLSPHGGMPSNADTIPLKTTEDRVNAVKMMLAANNQE